MEMKDSLETERIGRGRFQFGYTVMGPILAECCHVLHARLQAAAAAEPSLVVLFCARGGLTIRNALHQYCTRMGKAVPAPTKDFMASRLTAARIALETCPDQVERLLALEFEGRDCRSVASALAGLGSPDGSEWRRPYDLQRFLRLLSDSPEGRRVRDEIATQADLLRRHFARLTATARAIVLVDTGVFGSISKFFSVGMDCPKIETWMLFRAHYKKGSCVEQPSGEGLICDQDYYAPWRPRSVFRLYWPLLESFFEPDLPSVRHYTVTPSGDVISNLEIDDWRDRLAPGPTSLRAGANAYLLNMKPGSAGEIRKRASAAWIELRRRVVFPTDDDVACLSLTPRGIDFGFTDTVVFDISGLHGNPLSRLAQARRSFWPEGAIRKALPATGTAFLVAMEAWRCAKAALMETADKLQPPTGREQRQR